MIMMIIANFLPSKILHAAPHIWLHKLQDQFLKFFALELCIDIANCYIIPLELIE